jgi:DeoR/GlpR family transcriptional regulator of sugar metabolism
MKDFIEKELLKELEKNEISKTDDLANVLGVSPSTIRRALTELQNKGLITRTHGGAKISDEKNYYPNFSFRSHMNCLEKKKIALSAIKLIKNGDVIFLDGSTSAFFIAEYLSEFNNIKVFTNGIDTLSLLSKYNINAYSTGGHVSKENPSVLVGHYADALIRSIHADISFFSAQTVLDNGEIYDCFEQENVLRESMIRNSNISVFLCDSTKFGKSAPFRLCNINEVDFIVSDKLAENYFKTSVKTKFFTL